MLVSPDWHKEFNAICEELRTDTILLESLLLRAGEGYSSNLPPTRDALLRSAQTLLDYLAQHVDELRHTAARLDPVSTSPTAPAGASSPPPAAPAAR